MPSSQSLVYICIYFVLCLCITVKCDDNVNCVGENGQIVDWFVIYKLPEHHRKSDQGVRYFYMDDKQPHWKLSDNFINATSGHAVSWTLQQLYQNPTNEGGILSLMYNDETPSGRTSFTRGHTKGVVAFGSEDGFWLVHSVPKFPPASSYEYPHSGQMYGQSFLCISLPTKVNVDLVLGQLYIAYPNIYAHVVPALFADNVVLKSLLAGKHNESVTSNLAPLISRNRKAFYSFVKNKEYANDLYSAWLAPWLKDTVYVESWMNGRNPLPSQCSGKYHVENVRGVDLGSGYAFRETEDHSKWAVALNVPWTCIGGVNRALSQEHRPGGTVCFRDINVQKAFIDIVVRHDECPNRPDVMSEDLRKWLRMKIQSRRGSWRSVESPVIRPQSAAMVTRMSDLFQKVRNLRSQKLNHL